jgi:hypothetical protein
MEYTKTSFDKVMDHLISLEQYEQYCFNLSSITKTFLKLMAAEQGFAGNSCYLNFVKLVFPQ